MPPLDAQQTQSFSVPPSEIDVNRALVEKALGYAAAPAIVSHTIDDILPHLGDHLEIACGFTILPAHTVRVADDMLLLDGTEFSTGSIIAKRLRSAKTIALFAATIGAGLEQWSRELMSRSDMVKGYIVDTIGSEVVEQVADWLEKKLAGSVEPSGWRLTNRYSPGYCGWSVAEQHKLFSFLPESFCGIRLTESALMIPIKSVSGIIGLGPNAKREEYQCAICDMSNCFRRHVE